MNENKRLKENKLLAGSFPSEADYEKRSAAISLSSLMIRTFRSLTLFVRDNRALDYRLGSYTVRGILSRLSWWLLRSAVPNPLVVDGHRIYHNGQPFALSMAAETRELETVNLIRRHLKPGMTFVDLGAHLGLYTLLAAQAVKPTGRVYAFEPLLSNFHLLRQNVVTNGYEAVVTIIFKAILDTPGRIVLHPGREDSGASSVFATEGVGSDHVEVESDTLDLFFGRIGWPAVDLVKVDIEGAEYAALGGMMELSRRNGGLKLIMEYYPSNLKAAGVSSNDLFVSLRNLGFARISVVSRDLIPVHDPEEIARLFPRVSTHYVNLFCEKEQE